jgi:hypothetical protein
VRDHLQFFSNVHTHLRNHATPDICDGDENQFATHFLHERFPGSLMRWLRRLAQVPADGEKFVQFANTKGSIDVPHLPAVVTCVQRFVAEQRSENSERARLAEQAKLRAAGAGRRLMRR